MDKPIIQDAFQYAQRPIYGRFYYIYEEDTPQFLLNKHMETLWTYHQDHQNRS